jgi:hypothetical protein
VDRAKHTKPISPREAKSKKISTIPSEVFEAFNELIVEKLSHGTAVLKQSDVVERICSKLKVSKDDIYENSWLDVEPMFMKQGWDVEYDKPAYNETYEATFKFSSKAKR